MSVGRNRATAELDLQRFGIALNGAAVPHGALTVVGGKDGPVLGVHTVGDQALELIAEVQLIVNWEARPGELARYLHPHPPLSEAVGEAHLALTASPLHLHR